MGEHAVGTALTLMPWLVLGGLLAAYLAAARRERRRARGWSGWRMTSFGAGCALLAVALAPPLAAWAHHDPRGHMLQHLLLGMYAPLGLVLGAPVTLLLRSLPLPAARGVAAVLRSRAIRHASHPATALLLDVGALYLLYLTPLYAATQVYPLLHGVVQLHFLAAGCLFAWAIAGPDPAPHRPGPRARLATLFLAMAGHGTLAKLMYAYGWPRGAGHDPEQIRAAAQLMYYGGDVAELLLAVTLFAGWFRRRARAAGTSRALVPVPQRVGTPIQGGRQWNRDGTSCARRSATP